MFMFTLLTGGGVLGAILSVGVATSGVFIAFMVPIGWLFSRIFSFQRAASIDLIRMEGATRTPVYSLFAQVLVVNLHRGGVFTVLRLLAILL